MMKRKSTLLIAAIITLGVSLSACNDSDSEKQQETPEVPEKTILNIDASDYDNFVYYNLDTLEKINVANPKTSTDWHIAFRRSSIVLNGGDAGSGNVAGALAAENTDFYDGGGSPILSAFINATGDNQTVQFDAAAEGNELTEYKIEENTSAINDEWYIYNFQSHTVTADDSQWWVIRSGSGDSYAKFHVTGLTQNGFVIDDISFELNIQGSLDAEFSASLTTVSNLDLTSGSACYDIDTSTEVSCAGTDWDLYFTSALDIYVNSGIEGGGSGAAFGPLAAADITNPPINNDGRNVPHWGFDSTSGIFTEESWYAYNLEGNHKLWSNFNVYAIDTDTSDPNSVKIKAQIHSYYSENGASGHLSVRVDPL